MNLDYRNHITREMLRNEPGTLFVFGDNMVHRGYGGQAKAMRGEPNAVGIPTKWYPNMWEESFFCDLDYEKFIIEFDQVEGRLMAHTGVIVWPAAGIGTGRAKLKEKSLKIWDAIEQLRTDLDDK